jgi:hypothetical protein
VVELVDTLALGASGATRGGSSPLIPTIESIGIWYKLNMSSERYLTPDCPSGEDPEALDLYVRRRLNLPPDGNLADMLRAVWDDPFLQPDQRLVAMVAMRGDRLPLSPNGELSDEHGVLLFEGRNIRFDVARDRLLGVQET